VFEGGLCGPVVDGDGDGVGGVGGEAEGDAGALELFLEGGEMFVEVAFECVDDGLCGFADAEELEVGGAEHWGGGEGADGGVFEDCVWCAGDVPHCDDAAVEGFLDAEVDGVGDGLVGLAAVGADHVDPGDESGGWVVGLGADVGEVEVGVGVDEGGDDDLVWEVDGCDVCGEGEGVDFGWVIEGVDLPGVVVGGVCGENEGGGGVGLGCVGDEGAVDADR